MIQMVNGICGRENIAEKYFTIDTRTLTAPVLSGDYDTANGDYLYINDEFYKNQEKGTLDYQIEGIEIYRLNWTTQSDETTPKYEFILSKVGTGPMVMELGLGEDFVARVYATNTKGEKVYSDFSNVYTLGM